MEVLYQPEMMYNQQSGMLPQGSMHHQRMYLSERDLYMYYPYDTPSRTPTPEHPKLCSAPPSQTKTLQSVLMGEVPAAYSHLTTSRSPKHHSEYRSSSRCSSIGSPSSPENIQTEPMDLSCKRSPNPYAYDYSNRGETTKCQDSGFSLLRNLLSVGKSSREMERVCESPSSQDSWPAYTVTGTTRVTLAKKNLLPVSARVSDWLLKIVQFAKSIPEFLNLSHNDKVTLILNSWTRLLLLCMAESNFQFAVTPHYGYESDDNKSPAADEPTMKSVEGVQSFIRKCQHMTIEAKECAFLKMLVLFNSGYIGLEKPETVDKLNLSVQQLLQQHVLDTRPNDVMHYSRLLLCLPSLYGIDNGMIRNLFCRHINKTTDMEVLLKEMLQDL